MPAMMAQNCRSPTGSGFIGGWFDLPLVPPPPRAPPPYLRSRNGLWVARRGQHRRLVDGPLVMVTWSPIGRLLIGRLLIGKIGRLVIGRLVIGRLVGCLVGCLMNV